MADWQTGQDSHPLSMYLPCTRNKGVCINLFNFLSLKLSFLTLQKLYTEFELQGMEEEKLNSQFYTQVSQRMATEEATCVLSNADQAENGWGQIQGTGGAVIMIDENKSGHFPTHP